MSKFENTPEKPRTDVLAEKIFEQFLVEGVVTVDYCTELSMNPSLRPAELEKQKKNLVILLGSDAPDVDSDELAENIVNIMMLNGQESDSDKKVN